MSRLPHFLHNRFTDGGEVVSLMRRPPFTLRKIPGTHFCYRLSRPQGHSAAGRTTSTEKSHYLIGTRTRDLPACSIVPQPTTLSRAALQRPLIKFSLPHCTKHKELHLHFWRMGHRPHAWLDLPLAVQKLLQLDGSLIVYTRGLQ
jgi:hypothetical protein